MGELPALVQERTPLDRWIFARLDEIRAAALRWRDELEAATKESDTKAAWTAQGVRMQQIEETVQGAITKLQDLTASQPVILTDTTDEERKKEDEWIAGNLTDLSLIWKKIRNAWPADASQPAAAIAKMNDCVRFLDEIVYICVQLRLTPLINDFLENVEVGHELDLEFAFGSDFPKSPEMRKRLILDVAQQRDVLDSALVDPVRGVIYRLPPKQARWKSYWSSPLIVFGFIALLAALPFAHRFYDNWPFQSAQRNTLIGNYVLWILGALFHVLIQALRQMRAPTVPAFAVMDNWLIWLSVKQRSICLGIVWITIGYLLMSVFSHQLDWKTILLAGYCSDSLTDLFVQRFEVTAQNAAKSISSALTAKSPESKSGSA
jgi:hypothetical protein